MLHVQFPLPSFDCKCQIFPSIHLFPPFCSDSFYLMYSFPFIRIIYHPLLLITLFLILIYYSPHFSLSILILSMVHLPPYHSLLISTIFHLSTYYPPFHPPPPPHPLISSSLPRPRQHNPGYVGPNARPQSRREPNKVEAPQESSLPLPRRRSYHSASVAATPIIGLHPYHPLPVTATHTTHPGTHLLPPPFMSVMARLSPVWFLLLCPCGLPGRWV